MHRKNKPSQTIPTTELIWGVDVARIFGVSRSELHRRIRSGEIRGIRAERFIKGNMWSIYDAFSVAHPRADKRTIEELVAKFRQEKANRRGKNT